MAIQRKSKVLSEMSMSSMTDIVFLLLIFFMLTSTLVSTNALQLLLPKSTNQVSEEASHSVSVKDHGDNATYTFHFDGEQDDDTIEGIEKKLVEALKDQKEPTFSIFADRTVPVDYVVQLMNIGKRNHYKVILATAAE